jgi:mono/diheme cytochrome c family protein
MGQHIKHHSITVAIVVAILVASAGAFIYSGVYNLGADVHHSEPVLALMQILRDRSIHVHSKDIKVPNLEDPQLILNGAGHYAAMCTGCHLAPGMKESEIRPGLYPEPPNLSQVRVEPQDAFWVIKHGIKMSAMPAWGLSHDDPSIWSMVAFLQKLPNMTSAQYKDIVAKAPADADMDMDEESGHGHDGHDVDAQDTASAKKTDVSEETPGEKSRQGAAEDNGHPH